MIFTIIWFVFHGLGINLNIFLPITLDFATLIFFGLAIAIYFSAKKEYSKKGK